MGDLGPLKYIPTPSYGNYGGYYRRCRNRKRNVCPTPINWMDAEFQRHDSGMSNKNLVKNLKRGDPKKLGWYGKVYRWGAIAVFSVAGKFGF